jgi:pyridoxamine 5'-phosphate oxidase
MRNSDPLVVFERWLVDARHTSGLSYPEAFCLSTVDGHGFPQARYVDLKRIGDKGFLFGTRLDSPKAHGIDENPRVSMTFWWDRLERQVRIAGTASRASAEEADELFEGRSHHARVVTMLSPQSQVLPDLDVLRERVEVALKDPAPLRPSYWGAYWINPVRIEFLRFQETRLHERWEFIRDEAHSWVSRQLHP